jgi:competence protein ComEA
MVFDPFSSLAVSSRSASAGGGGSGRIRMRVGVGAAIVLLLAALGVAVTVTAVGQVGHSVDVAANTGAESQAGVPAGDVGAEPDADPDGSVGSSGDPVIFVHLLGAVARPGLFEVSEGARVVDVVAAAGGLLPEADQAGVNLARPLSDGEQLYIPVQGEVPTGGPLPPAAGLAGAGEAVSPGGVAGKVNLNTATLADLDTLPRIGPMMAQRILDYRDAEGRFASVDDLQNVTGIGEKTFTALKELVTV